MATMKGTFREVVMSTVPVVLIVYFVQAFILKSPPSEQMMFLLCTVLLIVGLTFFLYGVETGVNRVGESIGSEIPKRRSKLFMVGVIFAISFLATVAEPNVAVFAEQVNAVFGALSVDAVVYGIAAGVAVFLLIAATRIVYSLSLKLLMTVGYAIVLVLAFLAPRPMVGIAFDSGGVMTGALIIPVLLALSLGICIGRGTSKMEGFGTVGLAFIGPVVALLVLGVIMGDTGMSSTTRESVPYDLDFDFLFENLKDVIVDVLLALVPLAAFFILFQKTFLRYTWKAVRQMLIGLASAGFGMIIMLTGIYTGFMPIVSGVGEALMDMGPLAMAILGFALGAMVVLAEPAAKVLGNQVEDASRGAIKKWTILGIIAIGVGAFVMIGMLRVYYEIDLLLIVVPSLLLALTFMWLSDKDFVGIAFDGGAVATGPVSVAVVMPLYVGLAAAKYADIEAVINGFGVIFLMSLAPMIFVSLMGVLYKRKKGALPDGAL